MTNNPYYWAGKRDALAMRLPTWDERWTAQQRADYDAGYNA